MLKSKCLLGLNCNHSAQILVSRTVQFSTSSHSPPVPTPRSNGVGPRSGSSAKPRRPTKSNGAISEQTSDPNVIIAPPTRTMVVALDDLERNIKELEATDPLRSSLLKLADLQLPGARGANGRGWPEFALRKRSRALLEAHKERESFLKANPLKRSRMEAAVKTSFLSKAIMHSLEENDTIFVRGDTGSRIQAQVPRIILDHWILNKKGAECKVIAVESEQDALQTAWVASKQCGQGIGDQIGYEVEGRSHLPQPHGSITFATPQVLLNSMQTSNPDERRARTTLSNATHLIINVQHPRTTQLDILLHFLKKVQAERNLVGHPLKVIFTSTLDDLHALRAYFSLPGARLPPVIKSSHEPSPHRTLWLEDVVNIRPTQNETSLEETKPTNGGVAPQLDGLDTQAGPSSHDMISGIMRALALSKDGDILVVLPDEAEANALESACREDLSLSSNETIEVELAQGWTQNPKPTQARPRRKVILAVPRWLDKLQSAKITCVVDSVLTGRRRYDANRRITIQEVVRSTKAEIAARSALMKGRGLYIGMMPRAQADSLAVYPEPEIRLSDLSSSALTVSGIETGDTSLAEVFAELPKRPDMEAVVNAIGHLKRIGALGTDGRITPLGSVMKQLSLPPSLAIMVLYGALLRCLDPALTMAAAVECSTDLFIESFQTSTLVSQYFAYSNWEERMQEGGTVVATAYAKARGLNLRTLKDIAARKARLFDALYRSGFLGPLKAAFELPRFHHSSSAPAFNTNKTSLATLSALIALGLQNQIALTSGPRSLQVLGYRYRAAHWTGITSPPTKNIVAVQDAIVQRGCDSATLRRFTTLYPLGYLLLGATSFRRVEGTEGYVCDGWIPIQGPPDYLERLAVLRKDLHLCLQWSASQAVSRQVEEVRAFAQLDAISQNTLERSLGMSANALSLKIDKVMKSTVDLLEQEVSSQPPQHRSAVA